MTRINVVHPSSLLDQHLLAEFRELTRIPNSLRKLSPVMLASRAGKAMVKPTQPYILGTGHVKFFYNKLAYLQIRYDMLYKECTLRGFSVTKLHIVDDWALLAPGQIEWSPSMNDIDLNVARLNDRLPKVPRMFKLAKPGFKYSAVDCIYR